MTKAYNLECCKGCQFSPKNFNEIPCIQCDNRFNEEKNKTDNYIVCQCENCGKDVFVKITKEIRKCVNNFSIQSNVSHYKTIR